MALSFLFWFLVVSSRIELLSNVWETYNLSPFERHLPGGLELRDYFKKLIANILKKLLLNFIILSAKLNQLDLKSNQFTRKKALIKCFS